jgi:tetratricopeptide (TPR) repeat protein
LAVFGSALGALGRFDEALAVAAEAQAVAAGTGHPLDLAFADWHLALTLLGQERAEEASAVLARCIELSDRFGLPMTALSGEALQGRALCLRGRAEEALRRLEQVLAGCAQHRLGHLSTYALLAKAEACLALGRPEAAPLAAEAMEMARAHGYRAWEATALRMLAAAAQPPDAGLLADAEAVATALKLAPELALIALQRPRLPGN